MSISFSTFISVAFWISAAVIFVISAWMLYLALSDKAFSIKERRRVERINQHYLNWAMTTSDSQYWVLRRNTERQLRK
ncbi:TPA: hypothetical protein NJ057_003855 [Vibrio parahaemolyticus]|uniref:hypothetical protein n=1 Tax=Vibrio TaxID=662 RepID=UPI0011207537|nr:MULTISPECIES: hypothetical protein [Vibrio]MCF7455700.1 hypothetical protein [Vibrio sp. A1-1]MCZ6338174.1 hypothetical protein [Vibrio parahaemolyticus]MCZ6357947.1 hypothetical protein [Vibrio parahaemolyticus]MDF5004463.1 hypothetical protein [Vibrio parahaemolyticus]HCG5913195.1 hypothetical protein [Vibrio parahaemolyticus]